MILLPQAAAFYLGATCEHDGSFYFLKVDPSVPQTWDSILIPFSLTGLLTIPLPLQQNALLSLEIRVT